MKYLIWGTGPYCREKIDNINDKDIIAFVERKRIVFHERETILPTEITNYEYDYIIILSSHYAEIAIEIVQMGIDYKKIIPGINCRPFLINELEYMSADSKIILTPSGELEYCYKDNCRFTVNGKQSWERIREMICSKENAKAIETLDTRPVGKLYGSNRGGSICRYYLDEFLSRHSDIIKGKVLEVGDRNYTNKFGTGVKESYVLHFDDKFSSDDELLDKQINRYGLDFKGDLRTGEGIAEEFYDCIILTQVLNFVEDIKDTPDILVRSLKIGGKLLISVSGISAICRYDMDKYGQYWNFTDKSLRHMFTKSNTQCEVWTRGNCKAACAFLQGMGCTELTRQELDEIDEDFQVVIFALVTRIK